MRVSIINQTPMHCKENQSILLSRCNRNCCEFIPDADKERLLREFRNLRTKNEQDCYLQNLIDIKPVHRRKKTAVGGGKPYRGNTYGYNVPTSLKKVGVCRAAFEILHGVSPSRVRRLCLLLAQGKLPNDSRGKSSPGNAIPGATTDLVKQHISSFPVKIAHYTSAEKHYLSEKLDLTIMFGMFKEKYPNSKLSYCYYRKIFREHFDLSFGRPQVDTCCTCEELSVQIKNSSLNETAKRVAVNEKAVHLRRAKVFSSLMTEISQQSDDSVAVIAMDYMQNLHIPNIPVQEAFYLRQLTVNVFGIHNLKNNSAKFFVYHEGNGTKGPNEVCSFVMQYITDKLKSARRLHIFSDGCAAQNKNNTMVRMCSALVSLGKFDSVDQYFPIRGHSFLPCDRDFAVLKKKISKVDRVYTVEEYVDLIRSAAKRNRFEVQTIEAKDIIDFKSWWPKYYKKAAISLETSGRSTPKDQKVHFKVSQFNHFSHSEENKDLVVAKDYIRGAKNNTFRLLSKPGQLKLPTNPAYPAGKVPINIKKIDDIKKLKSYIPVDDDITEFYDEILTNWPTCETDAQEESGQ